MKDKTAQQSVGYFTDWLRFRYEREDIPGFVVAISRSGKLLFNEPYGYADLEKKEKMTTDHIFRIASHSKTFTATAIMQLQERGKLRIDNYVVDYVPWLKSHKDKRFLKITIRQLLSHSAGIIRDGLDSNYWELEKEFPNLEQFKEEILEAKLVIDNNTKMKYSNYGYSLLGQIVEAVSTKSYNVYVTENIIKPLRLANTGPELSPRIVDRLVTGYTRADYKKKRLPIAQIDTKIMSPATGFYSNTEDLCQYFTAQMIGSGKLLDDESKKEMQRIQWRAENTGHEEIYYGLGLEIEIVGEQRLLGHGGGFPGHITMSLFDPKEKTVVIILTNAMGSPTEYINKSIFKTLGYFQEKWKQASGKDLSKYQGRFMGLWNVMDFISLGNKLVAVSSNTWDPFDEPEELEHVKDNSFKIIKTSSFGSGGELIHFNFNKSGKVESVIYAGEKILPEITYIKEFSKKKKIG